MIKNRMKNFSALLLLMVIANSTAQISFDRMGNDDTIKRLLKLQNTKSLKPSAQVKSLSNKIPTNIASINEDEYIVDAGDQFLVKIDIKGPSYKLFEPVVTPDGFVVIPEGPTVRVKYLPLKKAKELINQALDLMFPDAINQCYLNGIHPINVHIIGSIPNNTQISLVSSDRLSDAVANALKIYLQDEKYFSQLKTISVRNIKIIRDKQQIFCDLGKFLATGKRKYDPYLMDNDVVYMAYKDTLYKTIRVSGAVGKDTEFEYKHGDDLKTAIAFAGSLTSTADSSRLELIRFTNDSSKFKTIVLRMPEDSSFSLFADDRIFVRSKFNFHKKANVLINGAVKYPGEYAIIEGKTKLTEVISLAGGFTEKASLFDAKIIRKDKNSQEKDPELDRLSKVYMNEMDKIEKSYYRLKSREIANLVSCNFYKLFIENDDTENVFLQDGDEIIIPEDLKTVYVSGGVLKPGAVLFKKGKTFEEYIEEAGGFTSRAKIGNVIIIKGRSKTWLDAYDDTQIEAGDIIFVPENEYWDWYEIFKDAITITAQLVSIFVLVRSLSRY